MGPVSVDAESLLYDLRLIRMALDRHLTSLNPDVQDAEFAFNRINSLIGMIEDVTTIFEP